MRRSLRKNRAYEGEQKRWQLEGSMGRKKFFSFWLICGFKKGKFLHVKMLVGRRQ